MRRLNTGPKNSQTLDLEQFREWAETAERLVGSVLRQDWSYEAVRALFEIPRAAQQGFDVQFYPEHYEPGRQFELPPRPTRQDRFGSRILQVHELFTQIIAECAVAMQATESRTVSELNPKEPHIKLRRMAHLLTDLLPTWNAVFATADRIPDPLRTSAVAAFEKHVDPLVQSAQARAEIPRFAPLEVLAMPFWQHRWHTYEIWMSVVVLRTLADFQPRPRIIDGHLAIDSTRAFELFGKPKALLVVTDGDYGAGIASNLSAYRECVPEDLGEALEWLVHAR